MHSRILRIFSTMLALSLLTTGVVIADNVTNSVGTGATVTITNPNGAVGVSYTLVAANGDGGPGCNAAATKPVSIDILIPAGLTVTASPDPIVTTVCATSLPATFTASGIAASQLGLLYNIGTLTTGGKGGTFNDSPSAWKLTFADVTAPSFTSFPAGITAEATSAAGAVVSYSAPVASDDWDGARPVTCSKGSG
ncbi:MAG TPA: hypothetical protein VGR28_04600, partial [Candidatus Thermoplasmatota archaeon]|nr:hypothetical protein [Candidatus Thermoplasmatota archaeon]